MRRSNDDNREDIRHPDTRTPLIVTGIGLGAVLVAYLIFPGVRTEINAAVMLAARADLAPLRDYLLGFGVWAPIASGVLQLITSIIAPLPSFVLALANALLYGFLWGAVLTYTTSLLAAAVCFGLARAFGRPLVERFVSAAALNTTDQFFERRGAWAVVIGRLIPFINPDVISYAAGLTVMRWRIFLLSVGVGALPSVLLYSWLGARGVTSIGWLAAPLIGLGIIAFLAALWHAHRSRGRKGEQ